MEPGLWSGRQPFIGMRTLSNRSDFEQIQSPNRMGARHCPLGAISKWLCIAVVCAAATAQDTDWFAKARAARKAGDYAGAAEAYSRLLVTNPKSPELLSNLGIVLHMAGKHAEALQTLRLALELQPDLAGANLFAGLSLLALDRAGEAVPYLERAHQKDPTAALPLVGLGRAQMAPKEYRDANEYFEAAANEDAHNGEAWLGLGLTYRYLAQSVEGHIGTLKATPELVAAATRSAGRPSTREELLACERKLDQTPDDLASLIRLSRACAALAVSSLERAVAVNPDSYEAHLALAGAWEETHSPARAIKEYEACVRLRSDDSFPFMRLAFLHWSAGNNDQALPPLRRALELAPDDPQVNACMGDILVRTGEHAKAKDYLERSLRSPTPPAMARIAMAQIYMLENHPELAVTELQKALPEDRDGSTYYMLAQNLRQLGRDVDANVALQEYRVRKARSQGVE